MKSVIKGTAITAAVAVPTIILAGAFAPAIAVALVGSNFPGLSGAALTSACLALLGGGAVLGIGAGAGIGGAVSAAGVLGKKDTILQTAKLMVSVREIFLNDEHDIAYSNTVYEQYVQNITDIEKGLVELRLKADVADKEEKKQLQKQIKNTEEAVQAMKIAMKSMNKFNSSFALGESLSE